MGHRVRTTTVIEEWQGGKWTPVQRTTREESTHAADQGDGEREHIVSDTEECWCEPEHVKVAGR